MQLVWRTAAPLLNRCIGVLDISSTRPLSHSSARPLSQSNTQLVYGGLLQRFSWSALAQGGLVAWELSRAVGLALVWSCVALGNFVAVLLHCSGSAALGLSSAILLSRNTATPLSRSAAPLLRRSGAPSLGCSIARDL